jgi:hypothetical protein
MSISVPLMASRRQFLRHSGTIGLTALTWPAIAASPASWRGVETPLIFAAYRNGSLLGTHKIDFSRTGERLVVDIEIAFDVKLAFIPLYSYRHKNREVWEGSKLLSLNTETDDNGVAFNVRAERADGRLLVDGSGGKLDLPGDTPTTSYWNEDFVTAGEWLDTQSGNLVRSTVTKKWPETMMVEGQPVEAVPYDLEGDITCSIWYADGRWVKLAFVGEDGSMIDYVLDTPGNRA